MKRGTIRSDDDEFKEIHCLRCNRKLLHHSYRVQCPYCLFYNDIMPEATFKKMLSHSDILSEMGEPFSNLDPLFIRSIDLAKSEEDGIIKQYAFPPITRETFTLFERKSPARARAFLKFLDGQHTLTLEEDRALRVFKSKESPAKLEKKLNYLKAKLAIVEYLEKTNL